MLNTLSKNKQTKKYKETFVRVKSLITIFTAADDSMGRALDGCFRDTTVLCYDGATLNKFVASKAHWVVLLICHHAWKVKSPQNSTFFFKMCLAIFQVIMSRANQRECARRLLVGTNMLLPSRTWHFVWCSVKFTDKVNALVNAYFSWYCREDTEKIQNQQRTCASGTRHHQVCWPFHRQFASGGDHTACRYCLCGKRLPRKHSLPDPNLFSPPPLSNLEQKNPEIFPSKYVVLVWLELTIGTSYCLEHTDDTDPWHRRKDHGPISLWDVSPFYSNIPSLGFQCWLYSWTNNTSTVPWK